MKDGPDHHGLQVAVVGEFVVGNALAFDEATAHLPNQSCSSVAVSLADTSLIDSAGLGAILRLRLRCTERGVEFGVQAPRIYQQEVFAIAGLKHLLLSEQG